MGNHIANYIITWLKHNKCSERGQSTTSVANLSATPWPILVVVGTRLFIMSYIMDYDIKVRVHDLKIRHVMYLVGVTP